MNNYLNNNPTSFRNAFGMAACLFFFLILSACTTPPNNGDLDGQWQVMEIKTIKSGKITKPKKMYYAFGQTIMHLRQVGAGTSTGNMHYYGDSIHIDLPFANAQTADRFGMDSVKTVFAVDVLTKETLCIHGKKYSLNCRKF